jgi:hypothetical protein
MKFDYSRIPADTLAAIVTSQKGCSDSVILSRSQLAALSAEIRGKIVALRKDLNIDKRKWKNIRYKLSKKARLPPGFNTEKMDLLLKYCDQLHKMDLRLKNFKEEEQGG